MLTARAAGHAFRLDGFKKHVVLHDLGEVAALRGTPLNITSRSPEPLRLISNFAATPFELDGHAYASVEGFWQCLRYPEGPERRAVAALGGSAAKRAGTVEAPERTDYLGQSIRWGTHEHWALMRAAVRAKFAQNGDAREALLSTGARILVHRMRRDSRSIPGALMAEIWMDARSRLRRRMAKE
jgi:predicted NAD-dependent protein-ADP-ribosyltransferase YbiA (DUF1768 family)